MEFPHIELVQIPNYSFIHHQRSSCRGGGVGFYIRNSISYRIIDELSQFIDEVFESLTIEAKICKRTYHLTSLYRSHNPPKNISGQEQMLQFSIYLESLLSGINRKKLNGYIFSDSNINLLNFNSDNTASCYHDLIF